MRSTYFVLRSHCMTHLILIKKQVGEDRSTVNTHLNSDCLLKNTSIKHDKYVVITNSSMLMISVWENFWVELFIRCQAKTIYFLKRTWLLYVLSKYHGIFSLAVKYQAMENTYYKNSYHWWIDDYKVIYLNNLLPVQQHWILYVDIL
jgi:hypothetical protein